MMTDRASQTNEIVNDLRKPPCVPWRSPTTSKPDRASSPGARVTKLMLDENAMGESFDKLSHHCAALLVTIDEEFSATKKKSALLASCHDALVCDLPILFDESRMLLAQMDDANRSITAWRLSVMHIEASLLLDTIQRALVHPQRNVLDDKLQSMLGGISAQIHDPNMDDIRSRQMVTHDVFSRLSPRAMPNLAFEVMVGSPVEYTLQTDEMHHNNSPLSFKLQPIVEILAQDLVEYTGTPTKAQQACHVEIEQCNHNSTLCGGGIVGLGFLQLQISNIGHDVDDVHVQEARCLQRNAFPPRPKKSVDIYSSSSEGSSKMTLAFSFQTFTTLNNEAPFFNIDLIIGSK